VLEIVRLGGEILLKRVPLNYQRGLKQKGVGSK